MKTLKNNILLYDSDCPACTLYTHHFVKHQLLEKEGRCAFFTRPDTIATLIDTNRAKNEIALVNTDTKKVLYGVDSLIEVVSHHKKWLNGFLLWRPVYIFLKHFYFFISYNRKVIMPSDKMYLPNSCTPAVNNFYRWAYILFTGMVTAVLLKLFITPVFAHFQLQTGYLQEFLVVTGQLFFQGALITLTQKHKRMDYLGNMMTVSFIGSMLLLPAIFLQLITDTWGVYALLAWFGLVVNVMLFLHFKRCKKMGIGIAMSIGWVVYRMLLLSLVLLNQFL